jgi:hypothetical protein
MKKMVLMIPEYENVHRDPPKLDEQPVYATLKSGELVIHPDFVERVREVQRKLVELMLDTDRTTAMVAIQSVLGTLWCNSTEYETITEALDAWRPYAIGVEAVIRKSFGDIKHGDKQ